jgi:hypothetical protein
VRIDGGALPPLLLALGVALVQQLSAHEVMRDATSRTT